MNTELNTLLASLQMGEAQNYRNITIFPLICPGNGAPEYRTLGEALQDRALTVAEVSQGGSVPELKVFNRGKTPVLLIDGEELIGAKQNRVLNTSILINEKRAMSSKPWWSQVQASWTRNRHGNKRRRS